MFKQNSTFYYPFSRLTDFDEIWHDDTDWPPTGDRPLKFRIFQKIKMAAAAILKNHKIAISPQRFRRSLRNLVPERQATCHHWWRRSLQQASTVWFVFAGPMYPRESWQSNAAPCISCSPPWPPQYHDQNGWHSVAVLAVSVAQNMQPENELWNWKRVPIPGSPWSSSWTGARESTSTSDVSFSVSSFASRVKKTAWAVWNVLPELTRALLKMSSAPSDTRRDPAHHWKICHPPVRQKKYIHRHWQGTQETLCKEEQCGVDSSKKGSSGKAR